MKKFKLLLAVPFLLLSTLSKGQCTDPPKLNDLSIGLEKCGDYYSNIINYYHDSAKRDSTVFTLNIFDILDVNHTTSLYFDETKNSFRFFFNNAYIPGEHEAFILQIIATNDCGIDSIDVEYYFENNNRTIIPDTSTCEGYIPSFISGPAELKTCDHVAEYVVHTPMYDSLSLPFYFTWRLTDGGATTWLQSNNDTLVLQQFPSNEFTLSVVTWDSCSCDGFKRDLTTVATLDISISEDSACGNINGFVYGDRPGNCFNEEATIPRKPVQLTEDYYAYTNNNGYYNASLYLGDYEVSLIEQEGESDCNDTPFSITLDADNPTVSQDLHAIINEAQMPLSISPGRARVGIINSGSIYIENRYFTQTGRELTLEFPDEVSMGNITPTPSTITGNTIRWSNITMDAFEIKNYEFNYTINQEAELGDELHWKTTLEGQPSYSDSAVSIVVNSYDPNEVVVNKPAVLDTEPKKQLKYTVHFQNTGNDTAYVVRVVDTLDAKLDMATLTILGASHSFEFDIVSGHVMQWTFDNINLVDSTSNEEKSKGWFQFFVDFKDNVVVNDIAESTAHIYFDTNEPIVTNTATSVITTDVGISSIKTLLFSLHPNPATTELYIQSNSQIASYQILSIEGRMVKYGGDLENGAAINVQELQRGIYYIKLTKSNGEVGVQPFEKM
jgi:uncharacterized repeat protein (TIGR01451 family)